MRAVSNLLLSVSDAINIRKIRAVGFQRLCHSVNAYFESFFFFSKLGPMA